MGDIHAVPDDKQVGTREADVIGLQGLGKLARLVEQHSNRNPAGAALLHELAGEGKRAAGFEDIVDEEHIPALHVALDVADEFDLAGGDRARAVARQRHELDLGRKTGMVKGTNEVRREYEAALEDRDDQKIAVTGRRNLRGELVIAGRNCLGIEQDAERPAPNLRHQSDPELKGMRPADGQG